MTGKVLINGRLYRPDARSRSYVAEDDMRERLSFATVEALPAAYHITPAPLRVSYTRGTKGEVILDIDTARDARPRFQDLPMPVRAAAGLHYLFTWGEHAVKRKAATNPVARAAVVNDILYKCALDVALDPAIPHHRPYIVDVSKDRDDFSLRGVVPYSPQRALALMDVDGITIGRAMFVIAKDAATPPVVHVVGEPSVRFGTYPLAVRLEARLRFFWHPTAEENRILYRAALLPASAQRQVWDEILCARADRILARERRLDWAAESEATRKPPFAAAFTAAREHEPVTGEAEPDREIDRPRLRRMR